MKKISVFISYKWQNPKRNQWVERLYRDLRLAGIDAKLDKYEVSLGESFSDYMTREIRKCDYVLFIITPKSIQAVESGKGALAFEMQISNARRIAANTDFGIIPIFREGKATTTYLSDHRYLDFRKDKDYDYCLAQLIDWLYGKIKPPLLEHLDHILEMPRIKGRLAKSLVWTEPDKLFDDELLVKSLRYQFFDMLKNSYTGYDLFPLTYRASLFLEGIKVAINNHGIKTIAFSPNLMGYNNMGYNIYFKVKNRELQPSRIMFFDLFASVESLSISIPSSLLGPSSYRENHLVDWDILNCYVVIFDDYFKYRFLYNNFSKATKDELFPKIIKGLDSKMPNSLLKTSDVMSVEEYREKTFPKVRTLSKFRTNKPPKNSA